MPSRAGQCRAAQSSLTAPRSGATARRRSLRETLVPRSRRTLATSQLTFAPDSTPCEGMLDMLALEKKWATRKPSRPIVCAVARCLEQAGDLSVGINVDLLGSRDFR